MKIHEGVLDLLFPLRCLGCGCPRQELCGNCSTEIRLKLIRSQLGKVPVFSSIHYGTVASHVLLAAKEDGVQKANELLVAALRHSLQMAVRTLKFRPALVPVPHSNQASRRRGRNFVGDMTKCLAATEGLPVRDILRHNRKVKDQSLLDSAARSGNLSGAMSVIDQCGRTCEVIVVDDLITSGATLGEAVRSLEMSGFHVVAAVTALVALPLR